MAASRYEIRVDRARCMSNGSCTYYAPQTFDTDAEGKVVLLEGRDPDDRIRVAADACPSRAIQLLERAGGA
jgi:ferredoxin